MIISVQGEDKDEGEGCHLAALGEAHMGLEEELGQVGQAGGSAVVVTVGGPLLNDRVQEGAGGDDLLGVQDVLELLDDQLTLGLGDLGALLQLVALGPGQDVQTLQERDISVLDLVIVFQHRLETLDNVSIAILVMETKVTVETCVGQTVSPYLSLLAVNVFNKFCLN